MEGEVDFIHSVDLPVSKSICNRLLVMEALAGKPLSFFDNECEDIEDMRRCILEGLEKGFCHIKESGTALRFLTAFFAIGRTSGYVTEIRCGGRLAQRPVEELLDLLIQLGMPQPEVAVKDNMKSIFITSSQLKGGEIDVPTFLTSQYASALLLIAPYMSRPLHLKCRVKKLPYVKMTARLMRLCGVDVKEKEEKITVFPGHYTAFPESSTIERDWSAASFFYEYCALKKRKIVLMKLNPEKTVQGDGKRIPGLFNNIDVTTDLAGEEIIISKGKSKRLFLRKDFSECPDLVLPFVVACCFLDVKFKISGLDALRHKESDRLEALKTAMRQMGYILEIDTFAPTSTLIWKGERCQPLPPGSVIEDAGDHRIAMAIEASGQGYHAAKPECVIKSFPKFFNELEKLTR